ncbi:alpha-L-fucosidase [Sulfodiicoccus acidiphilus]|uniref:alpha-L-fucosidase n=1 Tax=Sulfodiicoccus acidiphilus TaxID=1670455 RepID=A0A348B561_9CREN|nr:alpha-L-fucosidase [Sulfodiicoccus acidiphilus]BBD73313.1 alpha-L-fucosidase [Sulfodiicoccus acidiphilus]GGT89183.1 alpha-L-fucosidase [Sulfodiicoccus acidiphilus]
MKDPSEVVRSLRTLGVEWPSGPFRPSWSSLSKYEVPSWFTQAKFGVFVHWGPYSVPAFGSEWYPRNMYLAQRPEYRHHLENYGQHSKFGYKDFFPHFRGEKFDPHRWVSTFLRAGARYVVLVAEHHDGYSMWDSSLNPWNSKRTGPGRDVVGELASAARSAGLTFGVSYHRAEHWWYFEGGRRFESDVRDPDCASLYGPAMPRETSPDDNFLTDWLLRALELVDKYRPSLFYFDWWIENPAFEPYLLTFASYYYNSAHQWGSQVVINYKHNAFKEGTAVLDVERGRLGSIRHLPWQTDTSIDRKSWGYVRDSSYVDSGSVIADLVDAVSKNGNLLLNVGPDSEGVIPEGEVNVLQDVGDWLGINGEAIYDSRPWKVHGEGPTRIREGEFTEGDVQYTGRDLRFTARGDVLYVVVMGEPGASVRVKSLSTDVQLIDDVEEVSLLGSGQVSWGRDESGLTVSSSSGPLSVVKVKSGRAVFR